MHRQGVSESVCCSSSPRGCGRTSRAPPFRYRPCRHPATILTLLDGCPESRSLNRLTGREGGWRPGVRPVALIVPPNQAGTHPRHTRSQTLGAAPPASPPHHPPPSRILLMSYAFEIDRHLDGDVCMEGGRMVAVGKPTAPVSTGRGEHPPGVPTPVLTWSSLDRPARLAPPPGPTCPLWGPAPVRAGPGVPGCTRMSAQSPGTYTRRPSVQEVPGGSCAEAAPWSIPRKPARNAEAGTGYNKPYSASSFDDASQLLHTAPGGHPPWYTALSYSTT